LTIKEFLLRGLFLRDARPVETVKALNDVTVDIHEGERVALIGLNGAGKTTMLKTIAGVFPIQGGERIVDGAVGSLFDINVGFEPDATGWQNIRYRSYLQGETPSSIKEIEHEIGAFTELGHFLDLPIRCYSAGMVMRLAFAVATARCPEILLIDEVFGTGDLVFQQKAKKRMVDFLHQARIVVITGHQLDFLQTFCTSAIWLQQGRVQMHGPAKSVIAAFRDHARAVAKAA
jgi:ABC-type polysaccharide/polyol phosphate transport system ATPase subunit